MTRVRLVILIAMFASSQAAPAGQESRGTSETITVEAIGGFMGFSEGFCENPGGTYDWTSVTQRGGVRVQPILDPCLTPAVNPHSRWLGGVIGASTHLAGRTKSDTRWLVIAPNNRPVIENGVFLQHLLALDADAIGLGGADFDRLLRGTGASARNVFEWVRNNPKLPLLASNVAVRSTGLPDSEDTFDEIDGVSLHLPDDRTIGWNDTVGLHFPGDSPPDVTLAEASDCSVRPAVRTKVEASLGDADDNDVTLKITGGLRPDTCYWLTVATSKGDAVFRFRTDAALTPMKSDQGALNGFPVKTRGARNVIAVSLIDPGVRALARSSAWSWQPGSDDEQRRELIFTDPEKTLNQIIARATTVDKDGYKVAPIVILVSALSDEQTLEVLSTFPEIRFAILAPDSGLLGRAERRTPDLPKLKPPAIRYSGDLGFFSVVDQPYPQATRFLMRPEWVGETMISADAIVTGHRFDGEKRVLWDLTKPTADVTIIPGAALTWRRGSGREVIYEARHPGSQAVTDLATEERYSDCTSDTSAACKAFYRLWHDAGALAAMSAMSLRQKLSTDLAVISADVVEPDVRLWVEDRIAVEGKDVRWISRYILRPLLFASPRMVRATIPGSELPSVLQKILAANPENCISGLGAGCVRPDKSHPEHLTINGRRLDPRLHYSVVIPDALAESLDLEHDDDGSVIDFVGTTDAYLHEPLATEADLAGAYRGYLAVPTLSVGITRSAPSKDNPGVRANLPIDFSGAKQYRTWTTDFEADLALFDSPRWAVRVPMSLEYAQKKQGGFMSYDKDQFSVGARVDRKVPFVAGELRPFAGVFVDGPLRDHVELLTAAETSEGQEFNTVQSAAFKTPYVVEPNRYRHWAAGAEIVGLTEFSRGGWDFSLAKIGGRWTRGHLTRSPFGIAIDGQKLDQELQDLYLSGGSGDVLNEYFKQNRSTFSRTTTFELLTTRLDQARLQLDAVISASRKTGSRTFKGAFTFQYRQHFYDEPVSKFLLNRTQKYEMKLTTPIWRRLVLTPNVSYQRATIVTRDYTPFSLWSTDITASFPVSVRWGQGRLFR